MTQPSQGATVIAFQGVQLALPASLPFSYQNNCLVLDFSLGFTGKLTIQPVSKQLTTESPTLQLAKLSQHRSSGLPHAQQPVLEHQLSQPPDCSQGAYPPWMLQSSNPAFCIPDSIGTQSPMHRDRQAAAPSAVQPSTSTQQQQGQTRNAAALQELMTQAQPSELDAEDFEADTGTSDAGIPNSPVDAAILDSAAQQAVEQAAEEAVDQTVEQTDGPSGSIAPMQTGGATGQTPKPGGLSEDQTDKGRGAGTPAGPQEEFYSPPEHWRPDSGHHDECSTAKLQSLAVQSGQTTLPFVSAAKVAEAVVSEPVVSTAAPVPAAAPAAEAVQGKEATGAAAQDKTPVQAFAAGQTKTPANGKHRLLNKSVPPSSKRRKASAGVGALAEASFSWRPLEAEWSKDAALPGERWGGTLTCVQPDQVMLIGGAANKQQLTDAWMLNMGAANLSWAPHTGAALNSGRAWHSAHMLQTNQGRQLVMFGGERNAEQDENAEPKHGQAADSDDELEFLNELSLLAPDLSLWVPVTINGQAGKGLPRRTGHSCTVLPDGRLLVFGGFDDSNKYKNDLFVVDVNRATWYKMAGVVKGAPPKPRAYHTATLIGNRVVVMGGMGNRAWSLKEVYSLHLETWKWSEHTAEVEGDAPSPRYGHAAIALPDDRHVATFGGTDASEEMFFSSIALLDTLTWRWTTPKVQGLTRPCGRSGHGMVLAMHADKAVMVVHGGRSKGDVLHNDTWLLELPALGKSA